MEISCPALYYFDDIVRSVVWDRWAFRPTPFFQLVGFEGTVSKRASFFLVCVFDDDEFAFFFDFFRFYFVPLNHLLKYSSFIDSSCQIK